MSERENKLEEEKLKSKVYKQFFFNWSATTLPMGLYLNFISIISGRAGWYFLIYLKKESLKDT